MNANLAVLPNIARRLEGFRLNVRSGLSVINVIPFSEPNQPLEGLYETALAGLDVETIDIPPNGPRPPELIASRVGIELKSDDHQPYLTLLDSGGMPDVFHLRGLNDLTSKERKTWLRLFHDWADAAKTYAQNNEGKRQTCLTTVATIPEVFGISAANERLKIDWWWSVPSTLDLQILYRLNFANDDPLKNSWRESLLAAIAGNDLELFDALRSIDDLTRDEITGIALEIAHGRGWTVEKLEEWGLLDKHRSGFEQYSRHQMESPPKEEAELWLRGVLYHTRFFGVQVSTAALALWNESEQINHRIWQGQATLILPLLEEYRVAICRDLCYSDGYDWADTLCGPDYNHQSYYKREWAATHPYEAPWGLIEHVSQRPRVRARRVYHGVRDAKGIRNELSHGKLIEYDQFVILMKQLGEYRS